MSNLGFLGSPIPDEWTEATIAEVTSRVGSGATPRGGSAVYVESGASFIRSQNVYDHEFHEGGLVQLSDEAAEQLRGVTLESGDVLLNITGDSILRTCQVPESVLPGRVSQHVAIVRSNGRVHPAYLQKWLSLPAMKDYMLGHSSGGTRKAVTKGHILSFPIPVPPLPEQRGIAATLGALDDKIESNRRAQRLLDDLFQAHWTEVSSCATKHQHLGDLVSTQYGLTASAEPVDGGGPKFLRVTDINKQNWLSWDAIPTAQVDGGDMEKYQLSPGDLVVARMADPGKSAIYDDDGVPAVFASYLVRLKASGHAESLYIYGFLKSTIYAEYAAGAMTGSVQKNMNAKVIVDVDLPFPDADGLRSFEAVAGALRQEINLKVRENARLASLRDALLPELLSGRIRVPEAEEAVAEVVA